MEDETEKNDEVMADAGVGGDLSGVDPQYVFAVVEYQWDEAGGLGDGCSCGGRGKGNGKFDFQWR